jgi:hypothetical protein
MHKSASKHPVCYNPVMSPWWALVALGIFLIGVTKSGFGSGLGLMVVPLIVIAMGGIPGQGSVAALGWMLPLLIEGVHTLVHG